MSANQHLAKARAAQANWHSAKERGHAEAMKQNAAIVLAEADALSALGYTETQIWDAIEAKI